MKKLWNKFLHFFFTYALCPVCGVETRFVFEQLIIVFEDEPPMIGRWRCKKCNWMTEVVPTELTERAVRRLGYKDFTDYCRKVIKK